MLDDLDRTLRLLLEKGLPALTEKPLPISFAPPGENFPPQGVELPAISLFLYDVRANTDLRGNDWVVERGRDGVTRKPPPVRVDCSYLVTAWANDGADAALTEHKILGE